ncbi:hypothetical protein P9B03_11495 [Metasolibacillus meyeri]|uniref:Lipoprotein n=1 Tax=Metasolibacillus meyeri TaxID=1071052 RepID=A0AAW9NXA4_9BACL|nr:hypothetical protein [Metasolibacillus meyeri]MEC1179108.1 hypothetical protein [Metasolibacillus meyeri]
MKTRWTLLVTVFLSTLILTACMYPEERKIENQVPDVDQLAAVQRAITEFQADTGVLPIKTRDMDTDIFIKYLIDFEKLVPKYLASPPVNSFEKGGIFQYIIWTPEENPTVKLVDLRVPERIREVKIRFIGTKYPQYKESLTPYIYTINFEKIGYKENITVSSPYSNNQLPIIVSTQGELYVDYSIDLYQFIKEQGLKPEPGEDIRMLLAEHYPVVPAYSLPYTVDENNEPIFMYEPTK